MYVVFNASLSLSNMCSCQLLVIPIKTGVNNRLALVAQPTQFRQNTIDNITKSTRTKLSNRNTAVLPHENETRFLAGIPLTI